MMPVILYLLISNLAKTSHVVRFLSSVCLSVSLRSVSLIFSVNTVCPQISISLSLSLHPRPLLSLVLSQSLYNSLTQLRFLSSVSVSNSAFLFFLLFLRSPSVSEIQ